MAYPTRKEFRGSLSLTSAADAGQRRRVPLANGVRTQAVVFRLRATAQVAVAPATNLRNLGSVAALFSEIGLLEGSEERWNLSGVAARFMSEMAAPAPLAFVRADPAIGIYNLEEIVVLPMALPWQMNAAETFFIEKNPQIELAAFVTLSTEVLANRLFTVGGATVTVTAISVEVQHIYDADRSAGTLFIPTARMISKQITAAPPGGDFDLDINTGGRKIRAGALMQDSDVGMVADVINNLLFRGDRRVIIGPDRHPWRLLTRAQELTFAGRVTGGGFGTTPAGDWALGLNFLEGGRLSNILNPDFDTNWLFRMNAQTTAAAGATRTTVIFAVQELEEVPGITRAARGFKV